MILLNKETQNIKYVAIASNGLIYGQVNKGIDKTDLKDFVSLTNLGYAPDICDYCFTYYWNLNKPTNAKAIYLRDINNLKNEINNKLNTIDPNKLTKVYFDPNCKYPRFKLSSLTNIKRCLDPDKADSVVISHPTLNTYVALSKTSKKTFEDILILYSAKKDCYYLIDYCPDEIKNSTWNIRFQTLFTQYANIKEVGIKKWASALINSKVLPSDCKEFYNGKIILLYTEEEIQFISNLLTKYKSLIYDTELDRFISNKLPTPTEEDLSTLQKMLASNDSSVVDMGLKLLLSYDISSVICSVGSIIANNWNNISLSKGSRTVGFTHILSFLGLKRADFNVCNNDKIINKLYEKSNDQEDKKRCRDIMMCKISENIRQDWEKLHNRNLSNFNFTFKFTIE